MRVKELYKLTKSWMFEKPNSTIYDNYVIDITNKVLAELFEENNMCRMFNKKPPLKLIPRVEDMEDDLVYEPEYLFYVLPLGIDANFMIDDDLNKRAIYTTEYNNARVLHQKIVSQDVIDAFTK